MHSFFSDAKLRNYIDNAENQRKTLVVFKTNPKFSALLLSWEGGGGRVISFNLKVGKNTVHRIVFKIKGD